jgi:hypothetical protein
MTSNEGTIRAELTTAQNYDGDGNVRVAVLPIQEDTLLPPISSAGSG